MQFDLHQPFLYLFVTILCHVLRSVIACILLKVTLSMIAGTKLLCRNLSSPGTTRLVSLPFFSYCGLKIGADCGIIGNIINVRECSHKSEFSLALCSSVCPKGLLGATGKPPKKTRAIQSAFLQAA